MNNNHIAHIIFGLLSFSVVFLATIGIKINDREKYSRFLVSEYQKVSDIKPDDIKDIPKFDRPDLAKQQDFFACVDPELGRVPTERIAKAYESTDQIRRQSSSKNKQLNWENIPSDMGGRTRTLMWDPNDTLFGGLKVWAGAVTGGLWYNSNIWDSDSEWVAVNDFWDNLAISCMAYDPNNTQTFYVGTGESQTALTTYRESSGRGAGLFKSEDGGNTWTHLESTKDFAYISDIIIKNESDTSVIYAGVVSGVYMGAQHQSTPTDGLYRSVDSGESWEQVLPDIVGGNLPYAPADIELSRDGRIYVGAGRNLEGDGGATVLYSDEGIADSWTVFNDYVSIIQDDSDNDIPGRVMMAIAPSDENIVYALLSAGYLNNGNGFNYYNDAYLLKSENRGESWTEIGMPDEGWATLAWHAFEISVDPNDPDRIFVGGLDLHKTANGGNSWTHVSDWALMYYGGGPDYVHADQHAIKYRPGSSTEAIFSTDGGVFHTLNAENSSPNFIQVNNNYSTLQFYTCDIHPQAGVERYIGGLQDNGTLYYTGNDITINDMISGGDGAYCFYDKNEPSVFYSSVYYNRYYVFDNDNQVNYLDYYSGVFVNPSDYDSENNTLFANARTFGGSYNENILIVENLPYGDNGSFVDLNTGTNTVYSHIKVSPYSTTGSSTLFVGTQDGRIFKVLDAQNNPIVSEIGSNDFPTANISCIDVGASEDILLVTFSNYGVSSVWLTTDGGSNWTTVEGNLPDIPVRWCLFHPEGYRNALIATEIGVWECKDLNADDIVWFPAVEGLANVRVDMLKIREADNTVLAASHGRGLFTTLWSYSVHSENFNAAHLRIFPNPSENIFTVQHEGMTGSKTIYSILDNSGKVILSKNVTNKIFTVDLSDYPSGLYFIQIGTNGFLHKLIKI